MNSYPALEAGFLNPLYNGRMETRGDMGKAPYHLIEGRGGGSPKAQNTDTVGETADASKVDTNNNVGYNGKQEFNPKELTLKGKYSLPYSQKIIDTYILIIKMK